MSARERAWPWWLLPFAVPEPALVGYSDPPHAIDLAHMAVMERYAIDRATLQEVAKRWHQECPALQSARGWFVLDLFLTAVTEHAELERLDRLIREAALTFFPFPRYPTHWREP